MVEIVIVILALVVLGAVIFLLFKMGALAQAVNAHALNQVEANEQKQRQLVGELRDNLERQGDRLAGALTDNSERLRGVVSNDLKHAREAMQVLQLSQQHELATFREAVLSRLADMSLGLQARLTEQASADRDVMDRSLKSMAQELRVAMEALSSRTDERLEQIRGNVEQRLDQIRGSVAERLDEGFRKTNETFASVMARLAVIDEAQRKIDGLTSNVVSLQQLLGDKRARGAFGEVQLEGLVRNLLPPSAFEFQYTLPNGHRADCMLLLPDPTGLVAVDAKFPLENYHRMHDDTLAEGDRTAAGRQFRADLRRHVGDIAERYILAGETSDGAVMFIPAEAVFAEIHAHHGEVVDFAMQRHVWIVSPTTMMAVLNTARAVIKDVETRRQVHIIKDELSKLGKEFGRFDQRMRKLAEHIRQAHEDAEDVRVTSDKISRRFSQIERVELDMPAGVTQLQPALADAPNGDAPAEGHETLMDLPSRQSG